jgi:diguanylate cyclase (GGDEF)-like protein
MLLESIMTASTPQTASHQFGAQSTHPMNSSRLLMQLLEMSQRSNEAEGWDSIIPRGAMRSLMLALQYREPTVVLHSRRVAALSVGVAKYLGWEGRNVQVIEAASLLHDIGKVGIPDLILFKPGRLAPEEAELMGLLYRIASVALQACDADNEVIRIATEAQVHFNGTTHETGQLGTEMHQGARILAVADAYDSLITDQVYRKAHTHEEAMEVLLRSSGSQFDGNIVSALSRWFEMNSIPDELFQDPGRNYQLQPEEIIEAGSMSHVFSYLYLLESLYHGFYITTPDQKVAVWSHGIEQLTGLTWSQAHEYEHLLGLVQFRNRYGEPLADHERPMHLAGETGQSQTTELQLVRPDGQSTAVEVQTIPMINDSGDLCGFAEIFRDLSGERQTGQYRDLKLMASRDALTHVANRGELKAQLEEYFENYQQARAGNSNATTSSRESKFSAIFLDIDHFKKTNDTFGHAAGDEVLVSVARLLQHETYSGELIARYGGEEFVVLCPETKLAEAFQRAERLRAAIESAQVVRTDEFKVTASFGVAEVEPTDTVDSVIQRADKALYMSKHSGRNKTSKLTSQQQRSADPTMIQPPVETSGPCEYRGLIRACVAANMIVYKLKGFVESQGAKLGKVSTEEVTMQIGSRSMIPFVSGKPATLPVKLTLVFGGQESVIQRGASKLVEAKVHIQPLCRVKNQDDFDYRVRLIMKDLREYFAADIDDEETL